MIAIDEYHLLMIHPSGPATAEPLVDALTRKMAGALAGAERTNFSRGFHRCTGLGCRAVSDNAEHLVAGYTTNSLAVHYLAHHRADVSRGELAKAVIATQGRDEVEPTLHQLRGRS
jgi:hypothetical protein